MKYDCSNEFDLNVIYQKLTSTSCANTVKACNFFSTTKSTLFEQFQSRMDNVCPATNRG